MRLWRGIGIGLLITMMLFQSVAHASDLVDDLMGDLDYIDDIYKYDLVSDELTMASKAEISSTAFAVASLGIMPLDETGQFKGSQMVQFGEFYQIILMLSGGNTSLFTTVYSQTHLITQDEAVQYIVASLGYNAYEDLSGINAVQVRARLLTGIAFQASKAITREELAQMIYNALDIDLVRQAAYGTAPRYEIIRGETLLSERFKALEITGLLNAITNVNIYSTATPGRNRLEIDRIVYETDGANYDELLGRRVFGYAVYNELADRYKIVGLMDDTKDESIIIPIHSMENITSDRINYIKEDKSVYAHIRNVKHVSYNGTPVSDFMFSNELMSFEGKIVLGQSGIGGDYDVAVITAVSSYLVERVTSIDKNIHFSDGLTYEGALYISTKYEAGRTVYITRNGVPIDVDDIKPLDVISISQSHDKSYTSIIVSSRRVEGAIQEIGTDGITIADNTYKMSYQYNKAIADGNSKVRELELGDRGVFYLSDQGYIAGYRKSAGSIYGFLTEIGQREGADPIVEIKLFNQNKEWVVLELNKAVTLDGVSGTKAVDAYNILNSNADVFYQPVRYNVNASGRVTSLDTLRNTDEESNDKEKMTLSFSWINGKLDWTAGFNFSPTNYSITSQTVIFYLPADLEDEEKYDIITTSALVADSIATVEFYSADDFYQAKVATYQGATSSYFYALRAFAVNGIAQVMNDKGDLEYKLKGKRSVSVRAGVGSWDDFSIKVSEKTFDEYPDIAVGDLFLYLVDSEGSLLSMRKLISRGEFPQSEAIISTAIDMDISNGTLIDVDFQSRLAKLHMKDASGDGIRVYMPRGVLLWDKDRSIYNEMNFEDLEVGDKILATGNLRHACITVFR